MVKCADLLDKTLTSTAVGLCYSGALKSGARKITWKEFQSGDKSAVARLAEKKFPDESLEDAIKKIKEALEGAAWETTGTTVGKVPTKSLEEATGVYKQGGGSNKDKDKDLSALANRGVKTDARGVPISKEHH